MRGRLRPGPGGRPLVHGHRPRAQDRPVRTLVASYDVVIGYTGIVSFGHAMFFGFGAYAVASAS